MTKISDYIKLSQTAKSINKAFSTPLDFKIYYDGVFESEKESLIRHFIMNNVPFAFRDCPMLYEQIVQYISNKLEVAANEVKLIGSAKTGFSISPAPAYGRPFGQDSDLDFSIVNPELLKKLQNEFTMWSAFFRSKQMMPNNETERGYWLDNLERVPRKLRRGFIDSHLIPNRDPFIETRKINNCLWLIQKELYSRHSIIVKKVSASIYNTWNSFAGRVLTNTEWVIHKLNSK